MAAEGCQLLRKGRRPVGAGVPDRPGAGLTQVLGMDRAAKVSRQAQVPSGKMTASPGWGSCSTRKGSLWVAVGAAVGF